MPNMKKKTCFVAIGYGPKTDYPTGRILNLDKTYEHLIKPVFDDLQIDCFRASEVKHTGVIDVPMYEWLFKADVVIADISTFNPNALYELGVRHALRPNSTIVISEMEMAYPFDLNHTLITRYEHLGIDIGHSEVLRFQRELKSLVEEILKSKKVDSPVYTYLPNLQPPIIPPQNPPTLRERTEDEPPFSELIEDAETAKNNSQFPIAKELYKVCLKFDSNNIFLKQRLALVTYKAEQPSLKQSLLDAEKILEELNPEETTDPETLGLSGAINKRLYELTNKEEFLNKAIWFYEKGFYIKQDYYNGINFAYLLNVKALTQSDRFESVSYYYQANRVREQVVTICNKLIEQENFRERGDQEWIYQSLAQAYLGLQKQNEVEELIPKIQELSKGNFDLNTFNKQNKKLIKVLTESNKKTGFWFTNSEVMKELKKREA
jgi:hypothetical protein